MPFPHAHGGSQVDLGRVFLKFCISLYSANDFVILEGGQVKTFR